ncbi:hypothetical protein EST38_g2405 [Candolleomyces aberdarensis]|uniref:Uncharacterized protein n=1 Tax=Candolleomyces aberdarensis TaxID=2316362 RepID=A0A4Q2DUM7_9AGAR|nr:hypothetical protein EST38_g2405 [Candolleomyces aberdarensis]
MSPPATILIIGSLYFYLYPTLLDFLELMAILKSVKTVLQLDELGRNSVRHSQILQGVSAFHYNVTPFAPCPPARYESVNLPRIKQLGAIGWNIEQFESLKVGKEWNVDSIFSQRLCSENPLPIAKGNIIQCQVGQGREVLEYGLQ